MKLLEVTRLELTKKNQEIANSEEFRNFLQQGTLPSTGLCALALNEGEDLEDVLERNLFFIKLATAIEFMNATRNEYMYPMNPEANTHCIEEFFTPESIIGFRRDTTQYYEDEILPYCR